MLSQQFQILGILLLVSSFILIGGEGETTTQPVEPTWQLSVETIYEAEGQSTKITFYMWPDQTNKVRFELRCREHNEEEAFIDGRSFNYEGGLAKLVKDVTHGFAEASTNYKASDASRPGVMQKLQITTRHGKLLQRWALEGSNGDVTSFLEASKPLKQAFLAFCEGRGKIYRIVDEYGPLKDSQKPRAESK